MWLATGRHCCPVKKEARGRAKTAVETDCRASRPPEAERPWRASNRQNGVVVLGTGFLFAAALNAV